MGSISVSEAAQRLGVNVQRIHQRIHDGSIPAKRVGSQWIIEERDLHLLADASVGRPPSTRSAWALVDVAAPDHDETRLPLVAPNEKARAVQRLAELLKLTEGLDRPSSDREKIVNALCGRLRSLLGKRAAREHYQVAQPDLDDLRADSRLFLAGLSNPLSGIASAGLVEAYLAQAGRDDVIEDYLLSPAHRSTANVILHVVDSSVVPHWRVDPDDWLLLAADLADHRAPREELRATEIVHAKASARSRTRRGG